jgi:hypothetical protein
MTMTIDDFERKYRHLPDSLDATEVFGVTTIHNGVKTVGEIRKACEGRPKGHCIHTEGDGSGFYITEIRSTLFVVKPL